MREKFFVMTPGEGEEEVVEEYKFPEDQLEDLNDLVDFFDGGKKEEEKKEEKVVEEEKKEEISEFKPGEEEQKVVDKKEEIVEDKKEVEVDERDGIIAQLREEINKLSALRATDGKQQLYPAKEEDNKKEEGEKEKVKEKEVSVPKIFEALYGKKEFLSKEQLDEIVDKPELINEAIYNSRVELMDNLSEVLPAMINMAVNREIIMNKAVSTFYETYGDLKPHSSYVQMVFKEVESTNRDKTYTEIFELTAKESRKRLGLKEVSSKEEKPQTKIPAFAGSKGGTASPIAKGGKAEVFDKNAEDLFDFQP